MRKDALKQVESVRERERERRMPSRRCILLLLLLLLLLSSRCILPGNPVSYESVSERVVGDKGTVSGLGFRVSGLWSRD